MNFERITWHRAQQIMDEKGEGGVYLLDCRDEQSYEQACVPGAVHLSGASVTEFVATADFDAPVLVYCYHGNSSQSAAAYLAEQGFEHAYSIDGGFEEYNVL